MLSEKNGISLVPIINKVAEKPIKLKTEIQEGNELTLQFDLDLEPDEKLHYTINNGPVNKAKGSDITLELLEGNNVIFVCLSNMVGVSSTYWVKNYFNRKGAGSFDESKTHLFQNFTATSEGIVVDYKIMNPLNGLTVALRLDSVGYLLTPNITYLLQRNQSVRLELLNADGEFVDGPFNDTGAMRLELDQ